MRKKVITSIAVLVTLIIITLGISYFYIQKVISTGFDIENTVYIDIDNRRDYKDILDQLQKKSRIENIDNFKRVASVLKYPDNIKTGRYAVTPDMDILQLVRKMRSGAQTPVNFTFNNIRTKEDFVKRASEQLMMNKGELLSALNNPSVLEKYDFKEETIIAMFIPNTYQIYWDVTVDAFLNKMNAEYKKFWNADRIEKAQQLGLSPVEVSTLASIVEEECYFSDEYPIVAGLYLNRLKKGMLLQADPTVKYAVGDFSLQRVLNVHLKTDSPYNTYIYAGLPPGPIRIPSIKAIDGVLNPAEHNYIYMCAKEDFSGRHNFTNSHAEHSRNSARYRAELNKRRIYQ